MKEIALSIADIGLNFSFDNMPVSFKQKFVRRYLAYLQKKDSNTNTNMLVKFQSRNFGKDNSVVIEDDTALVITRKDFYFRLKKNSGNLFITPDIYSFDSFLRVYISYILNKGDGLLIHCSGFRFLNNGFVFVGKSGAGKTTVLKIFSEFKLLSDEIIPFRFINNKIVIFSSPFWGEMKNPNKDYFNADLSKIFFIKKHRDNFEIFLNKKNAFIKTLECVMNFSKKQEICEKIIKKVTLLLNINNSILYFSKSNSLLDYFRHKSYIK